MPRINKLHDKVFPRNKLHDVSADTMRATSTPILAVIARMAVNELEARAEAASRQRGGQDAPATVATMARGCITRLADYAKLERPKRAAKGARQ